MPPRGGRPTERDSRLREGATALSLFDDGIHHRGDRLPARGGRAPGRERARREESERAERERRQRARRELDAELRRQREVIASLTDADEALAHARDARAGSDPDTEFALSLYRRALQIGHSDGRSDIAAECAALLRKSGYLSEAIALYDKVLQMCRDDRAATIGKAAALADSGGHLVHEALALADGILSRYPADPYARKVKARAHARRGEVPQAIHNYERAAKGAGDL